MTEIDSGAQGRNRTTDTVIFSHVLYRLSYLGLNSSSLSAAPKLGPYRDAPYPCLELASPAEQHRQNQA